MKKFSLLFLFIILASLPKMSSALSCAPSYPYVAQISSYENNSYDSAVFNVISKFYLKDGEGNVDDVKDYERIAGYFVADNILESWIEKPADDYSDGKVYLPKEYKDSVVKGDIVVAGRPFAAGACSGNGVINIFDKNGDVKFVSFPAYRYEKNITGTDYIGKSVGDTEKNNSVRFTNSKKENFSLKIGEKKTFEDGKKIHLLKIKNKTDEIWFGNPYYSFVVDYRNADDEVKPIENNSCNINYSRLIRYGVWGEDVRQLQVCLNSLGYNTGFADGKYGPKTYAGIKKFQTSENIKIDGIVGPQTVSYLNKK